MPNPQNHLQQARKGEDIACCYLIKKGYHILKRNFRSRFGEIDIIATHQNILVFVEVKARWSEEYGAPAEAVTQRKIKSIVKTAQYYKMLFPQTPDLMRVDVVAIDFTGGREPTIEHIENVTQ